MSNPSENGQLPNDPQLTRFFLSPQEKLERENGKKIVRAFYQQQTTSDDQGFFKGRNARWIELLLWAKGSQRMQEFLDYMNVSDANKAWVNIDTTPQRLAAKFVGTLVESMSKNKIYPCVNAIDDGSVSEKEQRLLDALFRMHEVETINDLQQQSGVQLEPSNVYVPDDEMSAKIYFELEDRLPKEMRFEKLLLKTQADMFFEKVVNRKAIFDFVVLNFGCTKIERLAPNKYTVRKCVPTNMVYNFFMNDSGQWEMTQIGEFWNLKVKDIREKFGVSPSNPEGLTEKQIFDLAKKSHKTNIGVFNYMWQEQWATTNFYNRPYDDCNILIFDCEIDCGEDVYFVSKKDNYGRDNISEKTGIPYQQRKKDGTTVEQPKPEGTEIIKRKRNTWMRGVYAPYGDTMLYWGRPDIIITPFTDTAKPLSSYTINIPNNDGEYVPSLFERIIEPLKEYSEVKLKRKQLIAKLAPTGYRLDVESARNIDLGNGDTVDWLEIIRIRDQTGVEVWSSKGVNPLEPAMPPISTAAVNDDIQKILGLTAVLEKIGMEIRDLIGVPSYRDGADVGDRTAAKLQEGQLASSYNVTDYILNGNMQLWEETFKKICLLHWNDVVKQEPESKEDLLNTRFDVQIKMKITEYEKQLLEEDIQRYSQVPDAQGNPSLTLKDAMMIREIEDGKLARWYLAKTVEENRRKSIQESQMLQEQNAKLQQASNDQAAEKAIKLQEEKLAQEKDMEEFRATKKKEELLLQGFFMVAAKDETGSLIKTFMPAIQQLIPNIQIPLMAENKQMGEAIQQQAAAQQQPQQMQGAPMQ